MVNKNSFSPFFSKPGWNLFQKYDEKLDNYVITSDTYQVNYDFFLNAYSK